MAKLFLALVFLFEAFSLSLAAAIALCDNVAATAGGGLPSTLLPLMTSQSAIREIQIVNFLENLQASFLETGLQNITAWSRNGSENGTIDVVRKLAAQEQVHIATLANLLDEFGADEIPPCNYTFNVNTMKEFLAVADVISTISIGSLIGVTQSLADTDPTIIQLMSSILAVESRHDTFFRIRQGRYPSPTPFDTGISSTWAYNLALSFIQPGSCPVELPLPILPSLSVAPAPIPPKFANATYQATSVDFTWDPNQTPVRFEAGRQLFIGWVSQLDTPVYTELTIERDGKGRSIVPSCLKGVVFAALASQRPDNVDDLTLATLAGPIILTIS